MDQLPTTTNSLIAAPDVAKLREWLQKRHDAAVSELQSITEIADDEAYKQAEEVLATAKQLYDAMAAKRKHFTDPIKKAIEEIMQYENAINYTSKSENEYNRARKILEAYNQRKIDEKKAAEADAAYRAAVIKYQAEFRAGVQQQLTDMLAGKERTLVDRMSKWESTLTLENLALQEKNLQQSSPALKIEDYNGCFRVVKANSALMNEQQELAYLEELKKELKFEDWNNKYQEIALPIKNAYLAKLPVIRERLVEIAKAAEADAKKAEEMRKEAELRREQEKKKSLEEAAARAEAANQQIKDEKDIRMLEGDFTQQAMTQDLDAGPSKRVASFLDDKAWLSPFLKVVSKVAAHPKFKGIVAKDEYIPEVKKWLDFYASQIGESMDGITFEEKAKTIVRKSK